jgi:hypothetical protein
MDPARSRVRVSQTDPPMLAGCDGRATPGDDAWDPALGVGARRDRLRPPRVEISQSRGAMALGHRPYRRDLDRFVFGRARPPDGLIGEADGPGSTSSVVVSASFCGVFGKSAKITFTLPSLRGHPAVMTASTGVPRPSVSTDPPQRQVAIGGAGVRGGWA